MYSGFHLTILMRHWRTAEVDGDRKWYSAALAMIVVGSNFRSSFFFYKCGYSFEAKGASM